MARRPLAAALILGASALVLTGCLPMPPAMPQAPTTTSGPTTPTESSAPVDPDTTDEPTEPSEPSEPSAGAYDFTVDDGAGDIWSFSVTGIEANPPIESGTPEPGTYLIGILIDAEHVDGSLGFDGCFDILVVGSDGTEYDWSDTLALTAEDDIFYADESGFTQARAVVQLPEGVDPDQIIFRSSWGHPTVPDTVIDVE